MDNNKNPWINGINNLDKTKNIKQNDIKNENPFKTIILKESLDEVGEDITVDLER